MCKQFLVPFVFLAMSSTAWSAEQEQAWQPGTSPRIEVLKKQIAGGDSGAVAKFWQEMKSQGTPVVETLTNDSNHVLLTFLFRGSGSTKSVTLTAQLSPTRDFPTLDHLTGTDIWHKTYLVRNDLRFSYGLKPNPSGTDESGRDLLNPRSLPEGVGLGGSFIELSKAPRQENIAVVTGVVKGKLTEYRIQSGILNTERTAWIYTPAEYDANRSVPYPVLICFDGSLYTSLESIPTPTILDNLIAARKIPATIAIFIKQSPQPQRNIELSNNPSFADFVAGELLPQVRKKWPITADPAQTVVCGSSAGGLAALYFAFHRPDVFGNVLAQSAALWPGKERENPVHEWLTSQYEDSPKLPIRVVLQPGVLEIGPTPLNGPSILQSNRHLRDVLSAKSYDLDYSEAPGGHEALTWRGGLTPGLIGLLSADQPRQ